MSTVPDVMRTRSLLALGALALSIPLGLSFMARAEPPMQRGVAGHITVSPELMGATDWPVDDDRAKTRLTAARVRRPMGRAIQPLTEPVPELMVVVQGDATRGAVTPLERKLKLEGMRFTPGQILLPRPGPITIENRQAVAVTLVDGNGRDVVRIEAGKSATANLTAGMITLAVKELPYANASVRVLERSRVLPVNEKGDIPLTDVPAGDFQLAVYLGANPLRVQPLQVPEMSVAWIDASVSAKGVVDIAVRDTAKSGGHVPGQDP
jgi:hypothetical protein